MYSEEWKHFLQLFWNNNTALLSSNAQMDTTRPETQINGTLLIEVPITSRHVGLINYEYFMVKKTPNKYLLSASSQKSDTGGRLYENRPHAGDLQSEKRS